MWEWTIGRNPLLEWFAPPVGDMANHGYWTAIEAAEGITLYRSHGFGMNPIFFGATSAGLLIHAAIRYARAQDLWTAILFVVLGTLAGGGLLVTFSRGPWLACGAGLLLVAFAYAPLRKYLLLLLVVAGAYIAVDLLSDSSVLAERIRESDNVTLRFKLWQTAWAMFTDHPIFGVGLGEFPNHQLDVIRRHAIGPFFEMGDGRLETVKTAEHGVLQFLAENGIVGGMTGVAMVAAVLWVYLPALFGRRTEPERAPVVAAGTGFLIVLAVGFTVTIYNSWEAGSLVPVLLAVLCALAPPDRQRRGYSAAIARRASLRPVESG
jgi:O-antigen ligase